MKISIVHLSDLHISEEKRQATLDMASALASASLSKVRGVDACLILVTGDISYSGKTAEFDIAVEFLNAIRTAIANEGCPLVHVFAVPGNHDCQLVPENKARTLVIERIISDPEFAEDSDCVSICVAAQQAFFEFRQKISSCAPARDDPLWTDYEFLVQGKIVRLSAINASWMSRIPEQPGQLVFPTEKFHSWIAEPAELRIALIHHPINWYSQSSYHALRTALRTNCSIVLSGHEHVSTASDVGALGCGRQLVFEAPALQPHGSNESAGFSIIQLNLTDSSVCQTTYSVGPSGVSASKECKASLDHSFRTNGTGLTIAKDFERQLGDPGGSFAHPDKEHLEISDVFVFPEVRAITKEHGKDKPYSSGSDEILFGEDKQDRLLIVGEEKAGKTTLLFSAFREFHAAGQVPVYLQADFFSSFSENDILKEIANATRAQYQNSVEAEQNSRESRICLLDDLDRARGGAKNLGKLIAILESQFARIIATASLGFEIRELVNADAAKALRKYSTYEMCRFGNTLRHRLIRKWCLLGNWRTLPDLDREVHAIESVVNGVVSRNLTPALPIYLLILLQSISQKQQGELQNSSFARYYEYLMNGSLARAGLRKDEYDELYNYMSQLAWLFRDGDKEELTRQELSSFNRQYNSRYFTVDLESRLTLLTNARLLSKRGESYRFCYPYVYYFFLGRYLAKNINDTSLREMVRGWCDKLFLRKNSLAIVFLSYHSNDEWILDQVCDVLDKCFSDVLPIEFQQDIEAVNSLAETTSRLLIAEPDVDRNQVEARKRQDRREADLQEENDEPRGELSVLTRANLLLKSAEILGQFTKNYYGSLEREKKEELLKRIVSAPLRLVRVVFQEIADDPESLVVEMEKLISARIADIDQSKKRELARTAAFQLLGFVCTNVAILAASWIGSERLEEDISSVVNRNPTVAFKLVEAGTRLLLPRDLALDNIRRLAQELEGNPFAFNILQSMALRYMHLFHMRIQDRQRLCADLKIEVSSTRSVAFKTKNTRLLPRG